MRDDKWTSPVIPWEAADQSLRDLLRAAWEMGDLSYKLTPSQLGVYENYRAWEMSPRGLDDRAFCMDSSRRWGKSNLKMTVQFENAIRNKNWRCVYIAPTRVDVLKITLPLARDILQDCPPELIPTWSESKSKYVFHTGSSIEFVGLDNNPDAARGTGIDSAALDEAGFFDNLEYLMTSVLDPQMLGRTWARILAGSTPPVSPEHYWSGVMIPDAISRGAHELRTLLDADQYTAEEKEAFIKMAGGRNSTTCRREYFAEHITDDTRAVIPEYRDVEQKIVIEVEPPAWRDCYVSMDPGWKDLTAVLFGYWHFERALLVIEDEVAEPAANSREIARLISLKERELWSNARRWSKTKNQALRQPHMRISDNDLRLIADLRDDHGLHFVPTQKDNVEQQVNALRNAISTERILIHPRCVKLQKHLKNAVWSKSRKNQFDRSSGFGHFDLVAALVYLWRNVNKHRNPKPVGESYVAGIRVENTEDRPASKWSARKAKAGINTKWKIRRPNTLFNGGGSGTSG